MSLSPHHHLRFLAILAARFGVLMVMADWGDVEEANKVREIPVLFDLS